MGRTVIPLDDGKWRMGWVPQKPFGDVDDLAQVGEWLPAQVPGDVRLDLLRAGRISDPYYGKNNEDSQWVDGLDWWYVTDRSLQLSGSAAVRAFLVFEGIDYQSAVWANGVFLGRHAGMFSRQVYDVDTGKARRDVGRESTIDLHIAVRVWGSDALPRLRRTPLQQVWKRIIAPLFSPPGEPYPDRFATLKCQMQFGWDFAPRLRTCGIWDEACLLLVDSVLIGDVWVKAELSSEPGDAHIHAILTLDSDREQDVKAEIDVRQKGELSSGQAFAFDLRLARGRQTREFEFDLHDARRWDPWDRGHPNLYEMQVRILSPASECVDSTVTTFGIRSFELTVPPGAPPGAEPWSFVVNGEREFIRGANWVPLDAMPGRLTREDYTARLEQVRAANVNLLRVWGGGLREKRAFYDLCDELGILVWQEFPFAGAVLDRFPRDRTSLSWAFAESSSIVRTLRNHPALVVWCGGNEFNTRGNRAIVDALRQAVAHEDGTRPFKPASPYRDESHNWAVWHRQANLRDYRRDWTPFMSEFGLQSAPGLDSLTKFLPDQALYPPGELWTYHRAELGKLWRYAASVNPRIGSAAAFVEASQRAQAQGLQIAVEHMRRRKPQACGVAVWQFDDPWPAISWSIVDYYGKPKRAYDELVRLYAPLLVSFEYPLRPRRPGELVHGNLWVVNDWRREFKDVQLRVLLDGRELDSRRVDLPPDSATCIGPLDVRLGAERNELRLELQASEQVLAGQDYDLDFCDRGEASPWISLVASVYNRLMR